MKVDLNADMGEGSGSDSELLEVTTSANICCGLHAGSAGLMAQTLRAAAAAGVGLGAHPGFDDRANFGRTRMQLSATELTDLIAYQTGAAQAAAQANGLKLRHFKLHGALANMASEDAEMADTCYRAALAVQPDLVLMVLAATAQERAARALTQQIAAEIFADRAYNPDATLVDRSLPGAVLHDPDFAAERILSMLREGAIIAENGHRIPSRIDTICLHGDTPEAVAMARTLRARLESAGVTLRAL
ncbi:LamB/YcsF family protein [Sedimentimonas flavescens]|uniref:LamB/YcsF family protein n=1 Tax=Sedimentimonas flavescens TaxID=2851012 RepID=UPI001C49DAE3|nr:5-oxoprolinase subunit PxpA [Sedimentimonas flavescens]MBW0157915.1 LamB/YcsF family protein [Sedimentimonas flavescens]